MFVAAIKSVSGRLKAENRLLRIRHKFNPGAATVPFPPKHLIIFTAIAPKQVLISDYFHPDCTKTSFTNVIHRHMCVLFNCDLNESTKTLFSVYFCHFH